MWDYTMIQCGSGRGGGGGGKTIRKHSAPDLLELGKTFKEQSMEEPVAACLVRVWDMRADGSVWLLWRQRTESIAIYIRNLRT